MRLRAVVLAVLLTLPLTGGVSACISCDSMYGPENCVTPRRCPPTLEEGEGCGESRDRIACCAEGLKCKAVFNEAGEWIDSQCKEVRE